MDILKIVITFKQAVDEYGKVEDMVEFFRSLESTGELTEEEYGFITEYWDGLLNVVERYETERTKYGTK